MNEMQTIEQDMEDAKTLDYSVWSAARRKLNLPADHGLWIGVRDAVLRRQQAANAETGRLRRQAEETARAEKRKEADAEIDAELEPQKEALSREWLANHPGKTASDFYRDAWPHLRLNLVAERADRIKQKSMEEARAALSGALTL
jgi:hypothetical protein